jgi:hypothetical protein
LGVVYLEIPAAGRKITLGIVSPDLGDMNHTGYSQQLACAVNDRRSAVVLIIEPLHIIQDDRELQLPGQLLEAIHRRARDSLRKLERMMVVPAGQKKIGQMHLRKA